MTNKKCARARVTTARKHGCHVQASSTRWPVLLSYVLQDHVHELVEAAQRAYHLLVALHDDPNARVDALVNQLCGDVSTDERGEAGEGKGEGEEEGEMETE